MANGSQPDDLDILGLLEQIYDGDPAALRERGLRQAVSVLEDTHRRAALAMRRLEVQGVPAPQGAYTPPQKAKTLAPAAVQAGTPVQVVSGEGAQVDMGQRTLTHIVRPRGK